MNLADRNLNQYFGIPYNELYIECESIGKYCCDGDATVALAFMLLWITIM